MLSRLQIASTSYPGINWTRPETSSQHVIYYNLVKFPAFNGTIFWFNVCKDYFQRSIIAEGRLPKLPDVPIGLALPFKYTPSVDHDEDLLLYFRKQWNLDNDVKYLKLRNLAYKLSQLDWNQIEKLENNKEHGDKIQPLNIRSDLEVADSTSASHSNTDVVDAQTGVVDPRGSKIYFTLPTQESINIFGMERENSQTGSQIKPIAKLSETRNTVEEVSGIKNVHDNTTEDIDQPTGYRDSQKSLGQDQYNTGSKMQEERAEYDTNQDSLLVKAKADTSEVAAQSSNTPTMKNPVSSTIGYITVDRMLDCLTDELSDVKNTIHETVFQMKLEYKKQYEFERPLFDDNFVDKAIYDIHGISETEKQFAHLLESSKHRRHKELKYKDSRETLKSDELYICQVCNIGDSSEVDEIVFCSRCSITVHEACARVKVDRNHDWICDVCKYFESNGRYLPCALCTRRGGIMKQSDTRSDDLILKSLNPIYVNSCLAKTNLQNTEKTNLMIKSTSISESTDATNVSHGLKGPINAHDQEKFHDFYEKLYYNFFKEPSNYEGMITLI